MKIIFNFQPEPSRGVRDDPPYRALSL